MQTVDRKSVEALLFKGKSPRLLSQLCAMSLEQRADCIHRTWLSKHGRYDEDVLEAMGDVMAGDGTFAMVLAPARRHRRGPLFERGYNEQQCGTAAPHEAPSVGRTG